MRNGRLRVAIPAPAIGRRRSSIFLRTIIIFSLVMFAWLQLHVPNLDDYEEDPDLTNDSLIFSMVPKNLHKFLKPRPKNKTVEQLNAYIEPNVTLLNIYKYNQMQYIHNEEVFGPLLNDSLIIVVQVHRRITYLRHLIVSLAQARDIESVLLVFSHDYYDEDINELVQSIDFCKVMQIFYPHSIQTHPNTFPGPSPNDCPRDMTKEKALKRGCVNAEWPDLYGHYREAQFTQTKHHWWWKANRVFSQLEVTRYHTGLVLFLEEDHYVAEDFVHVLQLMQETSKKNCSKCNIYSLGTYLKTYVYYANSKKVEVTPWVSSKHNMGMALNKTVWNAIRNCSTYFCTYDDYNWDWSLQKTSTECLQQPLEVMTARGPRVFHIGECGFHHRKRNCEATTVVALVQQILKAAKKYLFPSQLTLVDTTHVRKQQAKSANGGWKDLRDHQLCLNISTLGR